jgi:hypothetical protein
VTISRAFYIAFGCAIAIEAFSFFLSEPSAFVTVLVIAGYLCLVALGFLLGHHSGPYRIAFANTWPFVLLWLVTGIANMQFRISAAPPNWTAETMRSAQWGYVMASILFLPLAFGASALGVWLAHRFPRFQAGGPRAA